MATKSRQAGTKARRHEEPDTGILVVSAALKRAQAAIEKQAGKGKLPEGSYPCELQIRIAGDITVAAEVPAGEPKTVHDFTTDELLGAMYAVAGKEGAVLLDKAMRKIKLVRGGSENVKNELDAARNALCDEAVKLAFARGVVKETASSPRAGAISGKPAVTVSGMVGTNVVEVSLAE
ncbi:MAG: hypothetical protein KJZ65_06630 [Phycisphaerales bacterium]|nr:hypothetical protein [Phycisphaerales bacterium]